MAEKKEIKFEDKIKKLEAIVTELESGNVDLDKAIDERYAVLYDASTSNDINRNQIGHRDFEKNVDMRSIKDEETGEEREMTPEEMIEAGEAAETVSLASDENVRALEENTMALNSATQAYAQGLQKASDAFDDRVSGFNGAFTNVSDASPAIPRIWAAAAAAATEMRPTLTCPAGLCCAGNAPATAFDCRSMPLWWRPCASLLIATVASYLVFVWDRRIWINCPP